MSRPMAKFVARRLAGLFLALLATSLIVYSALHLAPGSPLAFLSGGRTLPPDTIEALKQQYGLDQSFIVGYLSWLGGAVQGDFGESIQYSAPVSSLLGERILTSILLVTMASAQIALLGILLGVISGLRRGWPDTAVTAGTSLSLAIPPFVAAVLLTGIFAVGLGIFPVFGDGSGLTDRVWHLVLPSVALALTGVAYLTRITRSAIRDELVSEHVDVARGRGVPERLVIWRHVIRNALIPILTGTALITGYLIAGAVIVEEAFDLNGLGSFLVASVDAKDFPAVQGTMLILVTAFVAINTIVDLLYPLVDPRIKLEGTSQ